MFLIAFSLLSGASNLVLIALWCFSPLSHLSLVFLISFLSLSGVLGYNVVVRIPAGATNIDIKQVSYSGLPEDDNYLGEFSTYITRPDYPSVTVMVSDDNTMVLYTF